MISPYKSNGCFLKNKCKMKINIQCEDFSLIECPFSNPHATHPFFLTSPLEVSMFSRFLGNQRLVKINSQHCQCSPGGKYLKPDQKFSNQIFLLDHCLSSG